ncbi:hypothetical protein B296_00006744 [Ensete ventricosum]|uniref:Uncharacterized protein n=1 Tax=Ensete ventricosum TaxID=4639 RepID=A0A427AB68_ENSVE|nr:hypothetical protein B296_00006744 [Ensete ventricosum]
MLPALVETGGIGREENRQGGFISREIPTFYSLRLRPLQCPLPFPSPGRLRGCMVAVTRAYALWIGSALPAHRSGRRKPREDGTPYSGQCESQNLSAPPEAPQSSLNKTVEAVALLLPPQRPPNLLLTTQPRLLPLRLPSSGLVSYVKRKAPTPGSLMLH